MSDPRRKEIRELIDAMRVQPGHEVRLPHDFDPDHKPHGIHKDQAPELLQHGIDLLREYQDRLYAQDTYSVLLVLQAIDAAGKDGTIKHVMSGVNPQGCQVFAFKAPSDQELDHDFLWRTQKALPERGRIGIFNRSYYEEVLVVRVHPDLLARQPGVDAEDPGATLALLDDHPRLVLVRTLSKAYGLAGLRAGWALGGEQTPPLLARSVRRPRRQTRRRRSRRRGHIYCLLVLISLMSTNFSTYMHFMLLLLVRCDTDITCT